MSVPLARLAARIRNEVSELSLVLARIVEGWQRFQTTTDDYYLDSVALNLHDLYSGCERLFELIAVQIDGEKPAGENWHKTLLQQIASEHPQIRPAVISDQVGAQLDIYRGFRHIVRNVYAYKFDPPKVEQLVTGLPDLFARLETELLAFADFLDARNR
jgi:hypothetical protein